MYVLRTLMYKFTKLMIMATISTIWNVCAVENQLRLHTIVYIDSVAVSIDVNSHDSPWELKNAKFMKKLPHAQVSYMQLM